MFIRHLQNSVKFAEISDSDTIIIIGNYNSRKRIAIVAGCKTSKKSDLDLLLNNL